MVFWISFWNLLAGVAFSAGGVSDLRFVVAFNHHFTPAVTLAFVYIHFDGLRFFVFTHRHIHIGDAEIKVAVVLIKIVDAFQVLAELGFREAVAF